jgi:hypothetical protein
LPGTDAQGDPKVSINSQKRNHSDGRIRKLSQVAMYIIRKRGMKITRDTVAKLTDKFKKTGSVSEERKSGRPCISAFQGTTDMVQVASPKEHSLFGCRKRCQQIEYHESFEEAQMGSIQNATVVIH